MAKGFSARDLSSSSEVHDPSGLKWAASTSGVASAELFLAYSDEENDGRVRVTVDVDVNCEKEEKREARTE